MLIHIIFKEMQNYLFSKIRKLNIGVEKDKKIML